MMFLLPRPLVLAFSAVHLTYAQPPPKTGAAGGMGAGGCPTVACTTKPCPASCLNDVGLTTAAGTDNTGTATSKTNLVVGENIYGPFEAGFSSQQDNILSGLGCATGRGYVAGGIDTNTAEAVVAKDCGVTLPRWDSGNYISLLRECGGHTADYHFHEKLSCLYDTTATGHSTKVGEEKFPTGSSASLAKLGLYGKYESTGATPTDLDACGGHFGVNPDSSGASVYHYHVQDKAPFTFGCFGPDKDASGTEIAVTLAKCRSLYSTCSDTCNLVQLDVGTTRPTANMPTGSFLYHKWCPCYDANGNNVASGITALPDQSSCPTTTSAAAGSVHAIGFAALAGAAGLFGFALL